jgi:hypothetical protein
MESFYGRISKNDGNCQTGRREGGIIHYPVGQYLPMLGRFLLDAGCSTINYRPHVIDYSFGTAAYQGFRQDAAVVFKSFQPFIVRMGVATQTELDRLYEQMTLEMMQEGFRGLMLPLTAWGVKAT